MNITDLKQLPQHFDTVADRIWRAWWEPYGDARADLEAGLREVGTAESFPFTLVATRGGLFLGTVTAIQSDIAERPDLGPCIAALWVEPEVRGQGVAQALVEGALSRLAALGHIRVYLAAKPHLHDYYATRGWSQVESHVGDEHLDVCIRSTDIA